MTSKFIVLAALWVTVNAGVNPAAVSPAAVNLAAVNPAAVNPATVNPAAVNGADQYSFSYGVNDPSTGDVKDQHEQRIGDSVIGKYSVLESDGTNRVVEYSADAKTGYNAVVRKEGVAVHPPTVGAARPLGVQPHGSQYLGLGNNIPFAGGPGSYAHPLAYQTPVNPLALGLHGNRQLAGPHPNLLARNQYGIDPGLQHGFSGYSPLAFNANPLGFNAHLNPLGQYAQHNNPSRVSYQIQHPLTYANNFQYAGYNNQRYAGYANPPYSGLQSNLIPPLGSARGPTSYANFNLVSLNSYNHGTYAPHNQYGAPLPQHTGLPVPHHVGGNGLHNIGRKW